jgi:RHS repeat-associated protein
LVLETLDPLHDASVNPTAHRSLRLYDQYQLLPIEVTDAAGLTLRAHYDYRVLQPDMVTDPNGNVSRFVYTPLGFLRSQFIRGKTSAEGDQVRPSLSIDYDFLAYVASPTENRQPIFVRTIRQIHHDTELDVPLSERDETITTVEYSDGFGRLLQTRTEGEAVRFGDEHFGGGELVLPAKQSSGPGGDVVGKQNLNTLAPNVVVSGWQIYDNKGQVVEKYEPFFAEGWAYEQPATSKTGQKTTMFYDPRGQVIRTLNADGSEQRVIYGVPGSIAAPDFSEPEIFEPTPWEVYIYDVNDNAGRTHPTSSTTYQHHWDTPSSVMMDALARPIETVVRNRNAPATAGGPLPPIQEFRTRTAYDIRGNVLSITDPLGRLAVQAVYDYSSHNLFNHNIDSGVRKTVVDAAENFVEHRESKGALVLCGYDALNRPLRFWARDGAGQSLTLRQRLEYGDGGIPNQPASERTAQRAANRLGTLVKFFDEAGLLTFERYDFKGNLLEKTRHVIRDSVILSVFGGPPQNWQVNAFRVNWSNPAGMLAAKSYTSTASYDALNRVKRLILPEDVEHKRRTLRPGYNRAGALERVMLESSPSGSISKTFVERISYNAKGQRVFIAYGNGLVTRYAYDPHSFRLLRLRTERYNHPSPLTYHLTGPAQQDFEYEFDLASNLLKVHERTTKCGILNTVQGPDALDREFNYDALYRLFSATGRECDLPPDLPWETAPRCMDQTMARAYTERYVYDLVGNLQQLIHASNGTGFTRQFGLVAGNNRLLNVTIGSTVVSYNSDASGNVLRESASRHLEWDYADRLRVYRTQAGASEPSVHAHYLYDAGGQRVKKLVRKQGGLVEVTIYIDGIFEHQRIVRAGGIEENNTVHVMDNESRIAMVRIGNPFAQDTTPAVKYQLSDHLGSSHLVVDGLGNWVNREEYTPYGETSFGSFARKRYRFTGKERDEESGLCYHDARYYLPWLARWASCDPDGPFKVNLYAYSANPLSFTDTGGREPKCTTFIHSEPAGLPSEGNPHPISVKTSITICKPSSSSSKSTSSATQADVPAQSPEPPPAESPTQYLAETVITGEVPFEPDVSYPPAKEAAQGKGHIEGGDYLQFAKGLYHGLQNAQRILSLSMGPLGIVNAVQEPHRLSVDKRYGGAEVMGQHLGENLAFESLPAFGALTKGMRPARLTNKVIEAGRAITPIVGSGKAYSVAAEVELECVWGPGIPDELRRELHRIEAQDKVIQLIERLLASPDPANRKAGWELAELLTKNWEWVVHHHAKRVGIMQIIPKVQHEARELQPFLHPYIIPYIRRVGGFKVWGYLF